MLLRSALSSSILDPCTGCPVALVTFVLALACSSGDSVPITVGAGGQGGGVATDGGASNGGVSAQGGSTLGGASQGGTSQGGSTLGGASQGGSMQGGTPSTSGGASFGGAKSSGGSSGALTGGFSSGGSNKGGASSSGGSGGAVNATFASVSTYLGGYCATSTACHGTGAPRVVLRGTTLFATLTSKTVAKCSSKTLVVPNDPTASALYGVLSGGCGKFFMPPACTSAPCGTADNLKLVETWIRNGAPNN